jgi:hypothetical protein
MTQIQPNQRLLKATGSLNFVDAIPNADICLQGFGRNGLNPSCIQWVWDGGVGEAPGFRLDVVGGAAILEDLTGLTPNIRISRNSDSSRGVLPPGHPEFCAGSRPDALIKDLRRR